MKLIIKINEPHNSETLELDHVRPGYMFRWDKVHNAYVYHPKSQAEIDSIFSAQRIYKSVWAFIPLLIEDGAALPKEAGGTVQAEAMKAALDRANELLASATKRIEQLKAELAQTKAGMVTLKAECDKAIADAVNALKSAPDAPAKPIAPKKPHWKTLEKMARAKGTAPLVAAGSPMATFTTADNAANRVAINEAKASNPLLPPTQPTAPDDDIPSE